MPTMVKEYINRKVAEMLNKLFVKLTKSRPRHSNDNALTETKNDFSVKEMDGIYSYRAKTRQRDK